MSWLSWLTGNSKTTETVADGIYNGIDKIFYTEEEKAEASTRGFELFVKYQEATQPQNVARRLIAVQVVAVWLLFVVIAGLGIVFGFDYKKELIDFIANVLNWPFMAIMTFYYMKRIGMFNREKQKPE